MKKISTKVKIAIIVFVLLMAAVAVTAVVMAIGASDVMSNTATGSETLKPDGDTAGKALVVYTPGLTGVARGAATQIAEDLKAKGYEVTLAGVKSEAAVNASGDASGYDVIVVGGPVYSIGSGALQSYLQALAPGEGVKVGAFATGSRNPDPFPDAAWLKATVQLPSNGDTDRLLDEFVAGLLG